ncbi:hypothetical protein U5640_25655 [Streptomyces sp. SS7]|uniref:hypothetical protein n=1 Tax=Streptomyces sp. SS7 TaxID=3108485 RepID=UPI0030ED3E2F
MGWHAHENRLRRADAEVGAAVATGAAQPPAAWVLLGGLPASVTGLVEEYEPPRLSAAEVTGVWRGADGAELRLRPGGGAELAALRPRTSSGRGRWSATAPARGPWSATGPGS